MYQFVWFLILLVAFMAVLAICYLIDDSVRKLVRKIKKGLKR